MFAPSVKYTHELAGESGKSRLLESADMPTLSPVPVPRGSGLCCPSAACGQQQPPPLASHSQQGQLSASPACVSLGPPAPSQMTAFKCLRAASGEGRRPRAQAGRQAGSRAQVKTGGPKRPSPLRKGEPGKPPIERERQGRYAHLGLRWRVGSLSRNFAGKTELGGVLGPEFTSPHVA